MNILTMNWMQAMMKTTVPSLPSLVRELPPTEQAFRSPEVLSLIHIFRMLLQLKEQVEVVIVINADDIEKNKVRGDLGITYDVDVLRLIDVFRGFGLYVGSVVMTRFQGQAVALAFQERLESLGVKVYRHYPIEGYPSNIAKIVSDEGYGKNEYIETTRELVVVTAPGPGSGKMATCLSQLYHDQSVESKQDMQNLRPSRYGFSRSIIRLTSLMRLLPLI